MSSGEKRLSEQLPLEAHFARLFLDDALFHYDKKAWTDRVSSSYNDRTHLIPVDLGPLWDESTQTLFDEARQKWIVQRGFNKEHEIALCDLVIMVGYDIGDDTLAQQMTAPVYTRLQELGFFGSSNRAYNFNRPEHTVKFTSAALLTGVGLKKVEQSIKAQQASYENKISASVMKFLEGLDF